MMKPIIQDISEITDSRELYESKPHPFTTIFIYIILFLVLISILWMYFGQLDIVAKGNGIVRPNEKVSTIKNKITGTVEKFDLKEGQYVKQDDILYIINHEQLLIDQQALESELSDTNEEIRLLKIYKESLEDQENKFSKGASQTETFYYDQLNKYITDYKYVEYQIYKLDIQTKQSYDKDYIHASISEKEEELSNLNLLKQSIEEDRNLFQDVNNYYYSNQYEDYRLNLENRQTILDKNTENYNINLQLKNSISSQQLKEIQAEVEKAANDLKQYKLAYKQNLETTIKATENELEQLYSNIKAAELQGMIISSNDDYRQVSLNQFKMKEVINVNTTLKQLLNNKENLENQLEQVNIDINNAIIKAPIDGYISITNEINEDELLMNGAEVLTIIPNDDSMYKVVIYVPNKDIANISVGDEVKYQFAALPYKEYGEVVGKITNISTDATVDNSGNSYYLMEAELPNQRLYSYKGQETEIKVGMVAEAHIITDHKKILFWLLEKINLKD